MIGKNNLDINEFNKQLRIKTYRIVVAAFILVFVVAAAFNFRTGYTGVALVQIILSILYFISIIVARRGRYLEIFSNIIMYSAAIVLMDNILQFSKSDLGPYVGLIAILVVGYFLLRSIYSLLIYAILTYAAFLIVTLLGQANLIFAVSIKYQAVYFAIAIVTVVNKHFDSVRDANYEKSRNDLLELNKQFEAKIISEREAKEESDKLNRVMIGRELKMIELKEKLKK